MAGKGGSLGRRSFLESALMAPVLAGGAVKTAVAAESVPVTEPLPLLGGKAAVVFESPDSSRVCAYSPGLCRLESGRLVATMDAGGPGLNNLPGIPKNERGKAWRGRIYISDNHGATWIIKAHTALIHARRVDVFLRTGVSRCDRTGRRPHLLGVPFFRTGAAGPLSWGLLRNMAPMGWLETNLVQFTDPDHVWHDPAGRTGHRC